MEKHVREWLQLKDVSCDGKDQQGGAEGKEVEKAKRKEAMITFYQEWKTSQVTKRKLTKKDKTPKQ